MALAVERTGAAALGVLVTGASAALGGRNELGELGAVGGFPSNWMSQSLTPVRPAAMPGVWIAAIAGENGIGVGTLEAVSTSALRWKAPGDTAGAAVTIAEGETRVLFSGTKSKYIVVTREAGALVTGSEAVQLADTYNNWLGGSNWESAEALAGAEKGLSIAFYNWATDGSAVEDVKVWVDPDEGDGLVEIGAETPVDGVIQATTGESDLPTGVSWVAPTTSGTALDLGDLTAAGDWVGLWRRRYVGAAAPWTAHTRCILRYQYTVAGVTYTGQLRGLNRTSNGTPDADGIVRYELYAENGRDPDPEAGDTPKATGTSKPVDYTGGLGLGVWHCVLLGRNRWGVLSPVDPEKVQKIGLDIDSEEYDLPPSGPNEVVITPAASGKALISLLYLPATESASLAEVRARRATQWALYITTDGSSPLDADPVVIDMRVTDPSTADAGSVRGREMVRYLTDAAAVEGAPIKVIPRTRRTDIDSVNTAVYTVAAEQLGPERPRGWMTFEGARGEAQPVSEAPEGTYWIDEGNNLRIEYGRGTAALWLDTELVWRCIYDAGNPGRTRIYLNSDWSLKDQAVTGTGVADAFQVASWGVTHVIYVCVNGQRRLKIDADTKEIVSAWKATADNEAVQTSVPVVARYLDTVFVVWDVYTEKMVTYLRVDGDGVAVNEAGWNQWLTQSEIEALGV